MASRGQGGGKRARVNASSSRRITPVPGFENITLATSDQRRRLINLKGTPLNPTRFLLRNSMVFLGLDTMMSNLFNGTGLGRFYGMQELTYQSLTLEFLSSLAMDEDTYELSFRVLNEGYTMSLQAFANHLGLGRSLIWKAPDHFDGHAVWDCMSTTRVNTFTHVRVNNIQHPALRLWFRTVIGTVFGRKEVGTLNFTELSILGSYLNVQRTDRFALDLPYLVVRHMLDVAESRIRTIEIGGIITFLLKAMGFDLGSLAPYIAQERWIDIDYLRQKHHWLHKVIRPLRWRVDSDPERYITLPSNNLPALYTLRAGEGQGLPSYLIQEEVQERRDQGGQSSRQQRQHQEEAGSSSQNPSPYEVERNEAQFNHRRFAHDAANRYLETYWDYHGKVIAGTAQGPHPSYYRGADTSGIFEDTGIDQSQWGPNYGRTYGGLGGQFLDEFSRLNVGSSSGVRDDYGDDGNGEDQED